MNWQKSFWFWAYGPRKKNIFSTPEIKNRVVSYDMYCYQLRLIIATPPPFISFDMHAKACGRRETVKLS